MNAPTKILPEQPTGIKPTQKQLKNFWAKVSKTESCWIWTAALVSGGYGGFKTPLGIRRAHRFSWELSNGKIKGGLHVLHKCDNPKCVNPDHLFIGTPQDNANDRNSKGRHEHGDRHGMAKLNSEKVIEIRRLCRTGRFSLKHISQIFSVSRETIGQIRDRKTWSHL